MFQLCEMLGEILLFAMKKKGPPAINKVLPEKRMECQCVVMQNLSLRGINDTASMMQPPAGKFPVLAAGPAKVRIKAADASEMFPFQTQVVGGEESCILAIGVVGGIQIITEQLAGAGIWIVG